MSTFITVPLVGVGGVQPYTFQIVSPDPETTWPGTVNGPIGPGVLTIIGSTLFADTTSGPASVPGLYTARLKIIDSSLVSAVGYKIINIRVADPSILTILNDDQTYQPASFPLMVSIPLLATGPNAVSSWSLIQSVTTLAGVSIDNTNHLNFTLTGFGSYTMGVKVTDILGLTATKVLLIQAVTATAFALVDGQVEINVNVPNDLVGVHHFNLSVNDNAVPTPNNVQQTFSYQAQNEVSGLGISEAYFDHIWDENDTTTVVFPISGDFTGFALGVVPDITAQNGLLAHVDSVNQVVEVSGPPSNFRNDEIYISIALVRNSQQVALVSREFTLIARDLTPGPSQNFVSYPRPYVVGDSVGLNPLKPFFNSPSYAIVSGQSVRVQAGSSLPPGLSLDSIVGLIYGQIAGLGVASSVLEYIDVFANVVGTVTIIWDIQANAFTFIDHFSAGQIQAAYNETLVATSQVPITGANLYRGRLPAGLSLSWTGVDEDITVSGNPTEAGYFDVWIQATNANSQTAIFFKRFVIDYIPPLVIVTSSLANIITGIAYSQLMTGFGGVPPYTWVTPTPAFPAGSPAFAINHTTGLVTGTATASSFNQNMTFTLTDARGVSVTAVLNLQINNTLQITTPILPIIIPGQPYTFAMSAGGGTPPYTWDRLGGDPPLPSGISFNSSGVFSGVTNEPPGSETINPRVTDHAAVTATRAFTLTVGTTSGMLIDTSEVGAIIRGEAYQGLLRAEGSFNAPVTWSTTPDTPNPLPTGLFLTADGDLGVTATIQGLTTIDVSNVAVKVQAVDINGQSAQAILILNSVTGLEIATTSLPYATVGVDYQTTNPGFAVQASGGTAPYNTWTMTGQPGSININSSTGLITGSYGVAFSGSVTISVTDSNSPLADTVSKVFLLTVQNSTLAIVTTLITPAISGRAYNFPLVGSGGVPPYTWSISPASTNNLPTGLTLAPTTGIISGNSNQSGFSEPILFRLVDSVGSLVEKSLTVAVASGLRLQTGIDYQDSTALNILGYIDSGSVDSINPRPNKSFYVVATGVVSTTPSQITVIVGNAGITALVDGLDTVNGIAQIKLSGTGFDQPPSLTPYNLNISVTDSGVNVTATFTWTVYNDGVLRLAPSTGTIPIRFTTP